ncbi:MAG: FAD-dependent oxidoreductase [Leptolyngbya sp. SIO4C1]|nr:FAD-dependent oxidoreductase [Leptolyngbya sp. SIO4C1]
MPPILFVLDDDLDVLNAIKRDLRYEYGKHFRVLGATSGAAALETLKNLKLRNESVSLLISDQRMPQMTGIEFFEQALSIFPTAKQVLITAYTDTDTAVYAINQTKIDYFLSKPWTPPELNLYPIISDLLEDWSASFELPCRGIRVIGYRRLPQSYQIRDFLTRHQIPYHWLDVDTDREASLLCNCVMPNQAEWPLVLFPDGSHLVKPENAEIAEKLGLKTRPERSFYDLVIVGGGPSGLAAAVYGASEGLHTVMVEREAPGGQAGTSSKIENYLGFPSGLSGADLARRAVAQAKRFGVEILSPQEVTSIQIEDPYRIARLKDGTELSCHALLIATGVTYRKLDIPGLEALCGAGIYYGAATTEASACQGEDVYIVGGANSAGQAAIHCAQYARSVVLLVRGSSLEKSMSQYLIDQIRETQNITVWLHSNVVAVKGQPSLEAITVADSLTGETKTVSTTRLFIFIGAIPHTDWLGDLVERDRCGFVLTGPDLTQIERCSRKWPLKRDPLLLEMSVPGMFAVGDVRHKSVKRVASAVGEGAIAVQLIHQYLSSI